MTSTAIAEFLKLPNGGQAELIGHRHQLLDVLGERLNHGHYGVRLWTAPPCAGERERCSGVARRQLPGCPLHLQPHSMQPVELRICPWDQRSGVPKAGGGHHAHGRHHLTQQVLMVSNLSYDVSCICKDVCLLLCKTGGRPPPTPHISLFRRVRGRLLLVGCLAHQTRSHPKIGECLTRSQASQWRPLVQNVICGESDALLEVESCGDRLLALDPHPGPSTEVGHHLQ